MKDNIRRRLGEQNRQNLNRARVEGRTTVALATSEHVYRNPATGDHVPASEAPREAFIEGWELVGHRIVEQCQPVARYDRAIRDGARRSRVQQLRVSPQAPAANRAAPRERRETTRASSRSGDSGDDDPDPPPRHSLRPVQLQLWPEPRGPVWETGR